MVPPGGIEPTTSALPRMRSTTELRRPLNEESGRIANDFGAAQAENARLIKNFARGLLHTMDTPPKDPGPAAQDVEQTREQKAKAERAVRLAAALRTNLKRRKVPTAAPRPATERN